ncbi:MAG: ABC transporter permease subunit [Planctomycetota bacterium]
MNETQQIGAKLAEETPKFIRPDPPGFVRASVLIACHTVQKLIGPKRLIFLTALLFIPVFIVAISKHEGQADEFLSFFAPVAYLLVLAPLTSLFLSATNFADEVDNRTLGYLLLRPISRETLLFGQCLGSGFVATALILFSAAAAHLVAAWPGHITGLIPSYWMGEFAGFAAVVVLSIALYTALSSVAGLVLKRPVLWGIVYMVIVEITFCYAAGPPSKIAISHHTTRLLPEAYLTPEILVTEAANRPFEAVPIPVTIIGLGVTLFLLLGLAVVAVRRSEFTSKED